MRIRQRHSEEEAPVNLMPLIDMVFLLLIFFLVASTFAQEERDAAIQLPAAAVQSLSEAPPQLIVNIRADGTMWISNEQYDRAQLRRLLQRIAENEPRRKVLVRADEASMHRYFADVVGLSVQCGIREANIGYLPAE